MQNRCTFCAYLVHAWCMLRSCLVWVHYRDFLQKKNLQWAFLKVELWKRNCFWCFRERRNAIGTSISVSVMARALLIWIMPSSPKSLSFKERSRIPFRLVSLIAFPISTAPEKPSSFYTTTTSSNQHPLRTNKAKFWRTWSATMAKLFKYGLFDKALSKSANGAAGMNVLTSESVVRVLPP